MSSSSVEARPSERPGTRPRNLVLRLVSYCSATAIIWWLAWWLARGVLFAALTHAPAQANLTLLVVAAVASIALWMLSDTLMCACSLNVRVFTYFHLPTRFREMLPGTATHEFLQVLNGVAAGTPLAWFLHVRKKVNWLVSRWMHPCSLGLHRSPGDGVDAARLLGRRAASDVRDSVVLPGALCPRFVHLCGLLDARRLRSRVAE